MTPTPTEEAVMRSVNKQLEFSVESEQWLFDAAAEQRQVESDKQHSHRMRGAGITRSRKGRADQKKKRKAQRKARAHT